MHDGARRSASRDGGAGGGDGSSRGNNSCGISRFCSTLRLSWPRSCVSGSGSGGRRVGDDGRQGVSGGGLRDAFRIWQYIGIEAVGQYTICLLYTSDAADD